MWSTHRLRNVFSFHALGAVAIVCLSLATTAVAQSPNAPSDSSASPVTSAETNDTPAPVDGTVRFETLPAESNVPPRFRLAPHTFAFQQSSPISFGKELTVSQVTFPSPVETPYEANNTVHCEYFQAADEVSGGSRPAVVVLHILGGDFALSRVFCTAMATHGVHALFVKMPYYGPRRPSGQRVRMVSHDPRQTVDGMTQAVLDIRRSVAWLAVREEVDRGQIGICGISLGGITAALAATAEPRITKVCPILAGGDVGRIAWESPEVRSVRERWVAKGGTKESLVELLKAIDPVTYAANLQGRQILMLNASHDEVIPRACTKSLWLACGRPRIVWFNAGHYTAMKNIFTALKLAVAFFQPDTAAASKPETATLLNQTANE